MTEPEIVVLADPEACAAAAAERIAAALSGAVAERGRSHWATTGGSTPAPIYGRLAADPLRGRVPWDLVELWWGDDRFVRFDDPLSNVGVALRDLLGAGVPIPAANLHPFPTDEAIAAGRDAAWCAARGEAMLRADGPPADEGWPVFDVVLLGIGPDGHLLSVFPGSDTFDRPAWVLDVAAPTHVEPHVARVTMHPAILDAAREVLVVAHGGSKAPILAEIFGEVREPRRLPAQLPRRAGATWIVAEAAAARLPGR